MDGGKREQYLDDAMNFCGSLDRTFDRMEKEPANRDLVHQAFRFVHSLKSESQLVGADEPAAIAEEMEGVLAQIREGTLEVGAESLGILVPMVDAVREVLEKLREEDTRDSEGPVDLTPAGRGRRGKSTAAGEPGARGSAAAGSRATAGGSSLPDFSPFERDLVHEAAARGERLYRLACEIEESAPLKYPKAYLIVNNLELVTNVIRAIPSLNTTEDDAFRVVEVYFTGDIDEADVREAVDVDQVAAVEITEIPIRLLVSQDGEVPAQEPSAAARRAPSSVRVENGRLDDLSRRAARLHYALERLLGDDVVASGGESLRRKLRAITATSRNLLGVVADIRKVPLAEEFRHLPWLVRDLAARLGKQAVVVTRGEAVRVDRRLAVMLADPLVHLVRNAVDHGIENPQERVAAGKRREGMIVVSAVERNGEVLVQVGDDGRGISPAAVERRAAELGLAAPGGTLDSAGVLELLVKPGFSTREEPTSVSGRGVGLDAIYQKVRQSLGGALRMQSQAGKGTLFTVSIPNAASILSLLMVRSGQKTVGIALRDVVSVEEVKTASLRATPEGRLSYRRLPLYSVGGRVNESALTGAAYQAAVLRSDEKMLAFLCDELLFERDLPESALSLGSAGADGLCRAAIGDAEFLYLDVSSIE